MERTRTDPRSADALDLARQVEERVMASPLPTFADFAARIMGESDAKTVFRPRWWQFRRNKSYDCRNAGSSECKEVHTKTNGLYVISFLAWTCLVDPIIVYPILAHFGYPDPKGLSWDSFSWYMIQFALAYSVFLPCRAVLIRFYRACETWMAHAADRARRKEISSADILAAIKEEMDKRREETIGERAPLILAQKELERSVAETRALALRFNARIGHREGADKDAMRDGRDRAQNLLTRLNQSKEELDECVARFRAYFSECGMVAELGQKFEDLELEKELQRAEGAANDLIVRTEGLIIATTLRTQAEIATLQETAAGISVHTRALAAHAEGNSTSAQAEILERAIAEAVARLPAPPAAI